MRQWIVRLLVALAALSIGVSLAVADTRSDYFFAVANDNEIAVVNFLFHGMDPNTLDDRGNSGLMIAAHMGALKVADLLLSQNKVDVNITSKNGETALMLAALGGYERLVKTLLAKDADVNKTDWTPLHYAATKGSVPLIKILLAHSAYIDAESPNKSTPLMMAAMYGTFDAVKFLVEEGADIHLKNEQELTALDFAKRVNRADVVTYLFKLSDAKRSKGSW